MFFAVPFFERVRLFDFFYISKIRSNGGNNMQTRVAVMSIIVENEGSVEKLNLILHEFGEYIIGRMGLPYRKKKINIVSVALDAPQDTISSLAGKLGNIEGLSVKTAYSNVIGE